MLNFIYGLPLQQVMLFMTAAVIFWTWCQWFFGKTQGRARRWAVANGVLLLLSIWAVFYATVLTREPGETRLLILQPLWTLEMAKVLPELYRIMVMNVFLFFPFGLALAQVWPAQWPAGRRMALTALAGIVLSAGVEVLQYRYALGRTETDDVLCNTFGTVLGALPLCRQLFRRQSTP
ncbi:MAG TPA: VanZ family protein [Candidatus Faecousia faecigallinarum]|nr:VanZ family protein [Candidatus Faecousia faecigallinarum]